MTENMGKQIRSGRHRSALTQEKLAEALGVTPQAVSKWERGESLPDIALLPALSAALGLTLDELFRRQSVEVLRSVPPPKDQRPVCHQRRNMASPKEKKRYFSRTASS